MTLKLPPRLENALRQLAESQRRSLEEIVRDALREYVDAGGITDIEPGDLAATQLILAGELGAVEPWVQPSE